MSDITSKTKNPVLLIHGYSASYKSFNVWKQVLTAKDYDVNTIHTGNYITLTNEITIKDLAEGFDRALRWLELNGKFDKSQDFDVIVHSTGMLIVRAWLTAYATTERRKRLKHIIGLAPASFGSPLAHKGRSWLGSIFKGKKEFGPDFLEAGDRILDNLELGSSFTWELAHKDLVRSIDQNLLESIDSGSLKPEALKLKPFYGAGDDTPYVFIFCGTEPYSYERLTRFVSGKGTDGTVRLAGCSLNTRKITIDLTKEPTVESRVSFSDWVNAGVEPLILIEGLNHSTILSEPTKELVEMVVEALGVSNQERLERWHNKAVVHLDKAVPNNLTQWQQFVVRTVDERNDPITDYHIQLYTKDGGEEKDLEDFDMSVHAYSGDNSLRCFHVNLTKLKSRNYGNLYMRVIASSGSELVVYQGYGSSKESGIKEEETEQEGMLSIELNLSKYLRNSQEKLFYSFTTTLVEIRLNREPYPLGNQPIKLFGFIEQVKSTL